ncbi:MAG: hypothetical protein H6694_03920 [Candidatus Latescibacteria bacterium]|nr:hypothetical protein [Candidatus Latescibacterota bacterium]
MERFGVRVVLCTLSLLAIAPGARAAWQPNGLDVDPTPRWQTGVSVTPDGAGGMIVAWLDARDGRSHLFAQRLDAYGERLWAVEGITVAAPLDWEIVECSLAPDGEGGAYVAWVVEDVGEYWVTSQHLSGDGTLLWPTDGLGFGSSYGYHYQLALVATDDGGAMASWVYVDFTYEDADIAAMKLLPGGLGWPISGVVVSDASSDQRFVSVVPRAGGGAFFVYEDGQFDFSGDIVVHALNAAGSADWLGGVPLQLATGNATQYLPVACSDGQGGLYAAWLDSRNGNDDIYAARVTGDGAVLGATNGTAICTQSGYQGPPQIVADESGAIVAWDDPRSGTYDVYCQRVTYLMSPVFAANGIPVCDLPVQSVTTGLVADGTGGAIIVFRDSRAGSSYDLYLQRIDSLGQRRWNWDGIPLTREGGLAFSTGLTSDGAGGLLAAWSNYSQAARGVAAQRIERNGYWGYPSATIAAATDVPGDQGGALILAWDASRLDPWPAEEIDRYSLWRALPGLPPARQPDADWLARTLAPPAQGAAPLRSEPGGDRELYWELVDVVDAYGLPGYARTVPTWYDSTGTDPAEHAFQVIAHGTGSAYWISPTATGHSVDNLAPAAPLDLMGDAVYSPQGLTLTWAPNVEADLSHYAVYRGTQPDFPADASSLLGAPADTTWFDAGWSAEGGFWYKVAAVDVHANPSDFALLGPQDVTGATDGTTPALTRLQPASPNPFNPATTLRFDLATRAHVSLRVYDAQGRLQRSLLEGEWPAGRHLQIWDGRGDRGEALPSGVYLVRFEADGHRESQRVTLLK